MTTKLALIGVGHDFLGRTVLDGIDLTLTSGEIVALVGPSGCGKTTLLQIAAGLLDPLRGRIERGYARHACVFQEPRLLPWRTALDNVAYGLEVSGTTKRERRRRASEGGRRLGLTEDDLGKYPVELSGGMRQRVAIARAFAVEPEVVFFDEPFTALDVGRRRALQDLVIDQALTTRFSALFVTHDLAEAVRLAHRVVVLTALDGHVAGVRPVPGALGTRADREVHDIVDDWLSNDPLFAHVFDVDERRAA